MNPVKLLYARTYVRMNSKQAVDNWTDEEVLMAFSLLRKPDVKFEDWLAELVDTPGTVAPASNEPGKPMTEEQAIEHNSNLIGTLPAVAPGFQVIKD